MFRLCAALLGVTLALYGPGHVSRAVAQETAGVEVGAFSCAHTDNGALRCVAEIERSDDSIGMLAVAWGIDGGYLATDMVTGSVTSWVVDDPPPGDHVVYVAVVVPGTDFAIEATTDIPTGTAGPSWLRWLILVGAFVTMGAIGLWARRRRRGRHDRSSRCPTCSTPLDEGDGFCPVCGAATKHRENTFCSRCGRSVDVGDHFCPSCGTAARVP